MNMHPDDLVPGRRYLVSVQDIYDGKVRTWTELVRFHHMDVDNGCLWLWFKPGTALGPLTPACIHSIEEA